MQDTTPEMRARQMEIILSKTPKERFEMGMQMMEDVRQIVLESIRQKYPGISQRDLIIEFIKRYYGNEFSSEYMEGVIEWMKKRYEK